MTSLLLEEQDDFLSVVDRADVQHEHKSKFFFLSRCSFIFFACSLGVSIISEKRRMRKKTLFWWTSESSRANWNELPPIGRSLSSSFWGNGMPMTRRSFKRHRQQEKRNEQKEKKSMNRTNRQSFDDDEWQEPYSYSSSSFFSFDTHMRSSICIKN